MVARIVIAAPGTGHGKTSVATGLLAALRARGDAVSGHKIGPDFVDPGYHALATGLPPRNLDPFLQGTDLIVPLLRHGARTAGIAVIEGVMGLFDGALGTGGYGSTAQVATLVRAPVVLVVDAWTASRSVAATVLGFARYDPESWIAGVILNRVNSRPHEAEIREALEPTGVRVLGVLPDDEAVRTPDRRPGPVLAGERGAEDLVARLSEWVAGGVDLDAVVRVARSAPPLRGPGWEPGAQVQQVRRRSVIAAATFGEPFPLRYTESMELLDAAGIDVVDVDPRGARSLPADCAGLYLGGGFPEGHARELADNAEFRQRVATAVAAGSPVVAEGAGLVYLCRERDGLPMVGALDAAGRGTDGGALGYRDATAPGESLLTARGQRVRGHEFHRSVLEPRHGPQAAWRWDGRDHGFASPTLHASYLHVHWAGHPESARRFAAAVHAFSRRGR